MPSAIRSRLVERDPRFGHAGGMRALRLGGLVLLAGCASSEPLPPSRVPDQPRAAVRRALPAGTTVRVATVRAVGPAALEPAFADGLLREALRQSAALDFAGGVEDAPFAGHTITVHFDAQAATLTTGLVSAADAQVPLAAAAGALPEAIDRLALATRQALGDPSADTALGSAAIYSAVLECVVQTEAAAELASRGRLRAAEDLLREARPRDPGCTVTLAALAAVALDQGRADEAARIAYEGLLLEHRLAPTTRHRLARTLLMARAAGSRPETADRELLALAEATTAERPHDPHVRYSRALAHNMLSDFTASAPLLRALRARWPDNAAVGYHLCFAELALGRPQEARAAIDSARDRLPAFAVVLPRALALYHCGEHAELRAFLAGLANDPTVHKSALLHEVRRMQAAHALLTDDRKAAVGHLLADLEWIRQRPSKLEALALDVAEQGEVLVRIGHAEDLRVPLAAFNELPHSPLLFQEVLVFLGGLLQVASGAERATAAEASLQSNGHIAWSSTLRAAAHRQRGELQDELREWVLAYQTSESPLARAALARVLRAAGSEDRAREVIAELRASLSSFRLRPPYRHALVGPGAALAWLATL
jgi:tetratricopeptide (TPR) repeat protein